MHRLPSYRRVFITFCCTLITTAACAQSSSVPNIQSTGISGLWVLANVSFAGMRAQNNRSVLWRTLAFIFGLPGTIVTFFVVAEGSDRAYGIDLPRKNAGYLGPCGC
jgi:hypothetical protein